MLYKWVRDMVQKYSFITRTETRNGMVFLYFNDLKGVEQCKRVPYRASRDRLIKIIEEIKEAIHYYEIKKKRAKRVLKEIKKDAITKPIFITS